MAGIFEESIATSSPFDSIAATYDDVFSESAIGRSQRSAVWSEMDRVFQSGQRVLEINCGTGIDAVHLARRGVLVESCDSSSRMIAVAQRRAGGEDLQVQFRCLAIEDIGELAAVVPYDGVLSNFSGLNCVSDPGSVARNLSKLVKPGGRVVLCVFGTFCLWEVLWYLFAKDLRKAFRRFRRTGVKAVLAPSSTVTVHYRTVKSLKRMFAPHFRLSRRQGVGILVPPSYAARVVSKFPRLLRVAAQIDRFIGHCPLVRSMADHAVLTFVRVERGGS
jgi:SAM-dependent methyltransferase